MMETREVVKCPHVVVSGCTRTESDTRVSEKRSDIYVETVVIGFHAENVLHPANPLLFFL